MSKLLDAINPNTSNDIVASNYTEQLPYYKWCQQKEAEYTNLAGPVITRIDKAECEMLLKNMGVQVL